MLLRENLRSSYLEYTYASAEAHFCLRLQPGIYLRYRVVAEWKWCSSVGIIAATICATLMSCWPTISSRSTATKG